MFQPTHISVSKIFESAFHQKAQEFNSQLKSKSWKTTKINLFPFTSFIIDGDQFFRTIWTLIDNSKEYFWLTTYAMNNSPPADATLYKLIRAAKRGVNVVLFIDNVQHWAREQLLEQLKEAGGTYQILNPQFKIQSFLKYFSKDVWRRHHQKLIVTDNKAIIGSSNIEDNYGGIHYGNRMFRDLNFYAENIILDQFRDHFLEVAQFYKLSLSQKFNNDQLKIKYNKQFPNSEFYKTGVYKLLHNDRNKKRQIQKDILNSVKNAKKQIKIVQPYFFNMIKFNQSLAKSVKKLVSTEIITSRKRQQIVFQNFSNSMFFHQIMKNGTTVYETKERLLHSKIYLFDGSVINMGSMNNDRWSWIINNELNIRIESGRDYQYANNYFSKLKQGSLKVSPNYKVDIRKISSINFWLHFLYLSQIVMGQYKDIEEDCVYYETDIQE